MLDPFGADRGHQRRPMSVSRNSMELANVPLVLRDQCVHRWFAWDKCLYNLKPVMFSNLNCHEFEESWVVCRAFEVYRYELLKTKFMALTKDYTNEDKRFFPSGQYIGLPTYFTGWMRSQIASQRLGGLHDQDPANMLMSNQPNRALMRGEFSKTNYEREITYQAYGSRYAPQEYVLEHLPEFPLPEDKRPVVDRA
eukprot:GILJ01028769.1.p1 GENE.GILJ01028769.1~~GILJ01028769.1.p1  ORF type:complete len:209 (-),score=18.51 GILJ01028769.1:182-769(-)